MLSSEVRELQDQITKLKVEHQAEIMQLTQKEMIQMESSMIKVSKQFAVKNNEISSLQAQVDKQKQQIFVLRKCEQELQVQHDIVQQLYSKLFVTSLPEALFAVEKLTQKSQKCELVVTANESQNSDIYSLKKTQQFLENRCAFLENQYQELTSTFNQLSSIVGSDGTRSSLLDCTQSNLQHQREYQNVVEHLNVELQRARFDGAVDAGNVIKRQAEIIRIQNQQLENLERVVQSKNEKLTESQNLKQSQGEKQAQRTDLQQKLDSQVSVNQTLVKENSKLREDMVQLSQEVQVMHSQTLALVSNLDQENTNLRSQLLTISQIDGRQQEAI